MGAGPFWPSWMAGCTTPKYEDLKSFVQAHNHDVVDGTHRAKPTDLVIIASATCPEVDAATVPDQSRRKRCMLRLLGPVKVSMLTEQEIAAKMREAADPVLRRSEGGSATGHADQPLHLRFRPGELQRAPTVHRQRHVTDRAGRLPGRR